METHRRSLIAGMAVLLLVTAACGSTVPLQEQQIAETAAAQGLSDGGLTVAGTESGLDPTGDLVGSSVTGGSSTDLAGSSTIDTGTDAPVVGGVSEGENGPGITATSINVGISYPTGGEEANAAVGAAGATSIDYRRAWDAMVDYINSTGGVAERKLIPVYHEVPVASSQTYEQLDQEACAKWTQDNHVIMADRSLQTDTLMTCLEEHGSVIYGGDGIRLVAEEYFARYPHYVYSNGIDWNDLLDVYIDSMVGDGCLKDDSKIGLLTFDHPDFAVPVEENLIPRLAKYGMELTDVVYIKYPSGYSETGESYSQVSNAALRFRNAGVTHVLIMDQGAAVFLFFTQAAERQQYRPTYCLNSSSGNSGGSDLLQGDDRNNQMEGAMSIGWVPSLDVHLDDAPKWTETANGEQCDKIMRDAGIELSSANQRAQAGGVCEDGWFIQASLESAGPVINQETWVEGLGGVASRFQPGSGIGLTLSPTRRDGLAAYAHMKYFTDCQCFRYTTGKVAMPSTSYLQ